MIKFDQLTFEELAKKLYNDIIPKTDSEVQHVVTSESAISPAIHYLNKKKKNVIVFNWEIIVYLVYIYGFKVSDLAFISDAEWKSALLKKWVPKITIYKYNEETLMNCRKKFDGGAINPAFSISIKLREIAENLVTSKLLIVCPSRDFENPKLLKNIVYYKHLGGKAFSEQILTSLCISDVTGNGCETIIEDRNGEQIKVVDMPFPPGEDIDDWLYAVKIVNMGLPGYSCKYGDVSLVKNDPTKYQFAGQQFNIPAAGIPLVFNPGTQDGAFNKIINICPEHLDHATGFKKERLIIAKNGTIGKLGPIKIKPAEYGHGHNTISLTNIDDSDIAIAKEYLDSPEVARLVRGIKINTIINGVSMWKKIPHHKYKDQWITV